MDFPTPQHDRIKVIVKQVYNQSGTKWWGLRELNRKTPGFSGVITGV